MHDAVPNLTTAQTAPLLRFESLLLERAPDIEAWFRKQWLKTAPPFYGSVDLRNAGFKLAPVDTNLFPGGFNNLNPAFEALCVQAMQAALLTSASAWVWSMRLRAGSERAAWPSAAGSGRSMPIATTMFTTSKTQAIARNESRYFTRR